MTKEQWLEQYNHILCESFQNLDADLLEQLNIVERYLKTKGHLPNQPEKFHRIELAIEFYQQVLIPSIGVFPDA